MAYTQEFFSSEATLPKLVEWFNSQPATSRSVVAGELFMIRVKVAQSTSGEAEFIIGNDTTTADPSRWYMGESVFMWVGPSGTNLTATTSSFFEISRNVPMAYNVVAMEGYIGTPGGAVVRRMAHGVNYSSGDFMSAPYASWTIGISASGRVSMQAMGSSYTSPSPPNSLDNLPEVLDATSGQGFVAVRTVDNDVYVWGENTSIHQNIYNGPVHLEVEQNGYGDTPLKAKRIAALSKVLIFLREDGTLGYVGDPYQTGLYFGLSLDQFENVRDIRGYYWYDHQYNPDFGYELLYITLEDGSLQTWGWRQNGYKDDGSWEVDLTWVPSDVPALAVGDQYNPVRDVEDVAFNKDRALVLHTDGTITLYGNSYGLPEVIDGKVVQVASTDVGGLAFRTESGQLFTSQTPYSMWRLPLENATWVSGGFDWFAATTSDGWTYNDYYGMDNMSHHYDNKLSQIQAGATFAAVSFSDDLPALAFEEIRFGV